MASRCVTRYGNEQDDMRMGYSFAYSFLRNNYLPTNLALEKGKDCLHDDTLLRSHMQDDQPPRPDGQVESRKGPQVFNLPQVTRKFPKQQAVPISYNALR